MAKKLKPKFAKAVRVKWPDGRVKYQVRRVDNGRIISVHSTAAAASKKRNAINKFRGAL